MICKKCGTFNENYLEYCKNCASELIPDGDEAMPQTPSASEGQTKPTWGFVRSPGWPNPDLSADNVNEEDIPKGYSPRRFDPKPINDDYVPVNRPAPSPEPEEAYDYDYEDDIEPFDDDDPDKTTVIPVRRTAYRGASTRAESNRIPNKESRRSDQRDQNQIRYADPLDEDYFYDGDEDDDDDDYRPRGKRRGLARCFGRYWSGCRSAYSDRHYNHRFKLRLFWQFHSACIRRQSADEVLHDSYGNGS